MSTDNTGTTLAATPLQQKTPKHTLLRGTCTATAVVANASFWTGLAIYVFSSRHSHLMPYAGPAMLGGWTLFAANGPVIQRVRQLKALPDSKRSFLRGVDLVRSAAAHAGFWGGLAIYVCSSKHSSLRPYAGPAMLGGVGLWAAGIPLRLAVGQKLAGDILRQRMRNASQRQLR